MNRRAMPSIVLKSLKKGPDGRSGLMGMVSFPPHPARAGKMALFLMAVPSPLAIVKSPLN